MGYSAHFTPEIWIGGNAIEVDPDGRQDWDCTHEVEANPEYWERITRDRHESFDDGWGVLDQDDVLKDTTVAPPWVRNWNGPFTIRVFRKEDE